MKKRKRVRYWLEQVAAGALLLVIGLGLFVLLYAIGLTALGIDPSCAEELHRYPVARVEVNAGSCLNVRKTPGGERCAVQLNCMEDVVILATDDGWALVIRPEHVGSQDMNGTPLGWASMEYLRVYREHIEIEE